MSLTFNPTLRHRESINLHSHSNDGDVVRNPKRPEEAKIVLQTAMLNNRNVIIVIEDGVFGYPNKKTRDFV